MTIHVGEAGPPHREQAVAEFHVAHDGLVDIPAELFSEDGKLMIALYGRTGGVAWEYPLSDFLAAIGKGMGILNP